MHNRKQRKWNTDKRKKEANKPNQESNLSYATQVPSRSKRATPLWHSEVGGKDYCLGGVR